MEIIFYMILFIFQMLMIAQMDGVFPPCCASGHSLAKRNPLKTKKISMVRPNDIGQIVYLSIMKKFIAVREILVSIPLKDMSRRPEFDGLIPLPRVKFLCLFGPAFLPEVRVSDHRKILENQSRGTRDGKNP